MATPYVPFPAFSQWPQSPIDQRLWSTRIAELRRLGEDLGPDRVAIAVDLVTRAAAIDRATLECSRLADGDARPQVAQVEAMVGDVEQSLRRTYGLIAALASRRARISEAQIGCLHRVVTEQGPAPGQGGGDPGAARYRSVEIDVKRPDGSGLEGAPPERIGREMRRFIDELSSRQFACGHPAVQAAYAHYGLVAVHPFIDGNGRAARALGSVYLYRGVRIPLFVFLDQQNDYDDALTAARDHNCLPFVRFVFDAAVAGIALFQEAFKQVRSTLITA